MFTFTPGSRAYNLMKKAPSQSPNKVKTTQNLARVSLRRMERMNSTVCLVKALKSGAATVLGKAGVK